VGVGDVTLPVAEVFGPVWQGEGPYAGRRCSFLRLGLCNLHCEWCDTPFTWDESRFDVKAECPDRDADTLVAALRRHRTTLLVLSGGEPVIHSGNETLHEVIDRYGGAVHVETNGTRIPDARLAARVDAWGVSPKFAQNTDPAARRIRPDALRWFADRDNAFLKVVARSAPDVHAFAAELGTGRYGDWEGRVWIMPEGMTGPDLLATTAKVADAVAEHGFNLTLRQHTLMYGTERGR
jgi:organic radical activating enzyme